MTAAAGDYLLPTTTLPRLPAVGGRRLNQAVACRSSLAVRIGNTIARLTAIFGGRLLLLTNRHAAGEEINAHACIVFLRTRRPPRNARDRIQLLPQLRELSTRCGKWQ